MKIVWADTCEWVEGRTRAGGTGGLPGGNVEILEVFRSSPECVGGRGEEVGAEVISG